MFAHTSGQEYIAIIFYFLKTSLLCTDDPPQKKNQWLDKINTKITGWVKENRTENLKQFYPSLLHTLSSDYHWRKHVTEWKSQMLSPS